MRSTLQLYTIYFTLLQLYECRKSQNHIYVMLLNPFAFSVYLSIDLCFCSSYSSFLRRYVFPKSVSYGKMWASKLKKDVARRIRRLETVRLKWLQSVDISKVIAGMWFPYCLVSHQLCELLPTFASSLLIPNATFCVLFWQLLGCVVNGIAGINIDACELLREQ